MATKEQQLTARACRLLGEARALAAEAKKRDAAAKAIVEELISPGEKGVLESPTYGRIKKTFREMLLIPSVAEKPLREIFGDKFADYITRAVVLKPKDGFKKLLSDADDPRTRAIRPHVSIGVSPVLKFEPAPGKKFYPSISEEEPAMASA